MSTFRAGQKVVCVKSHSLRAVTSGSIYRIRNLTICNCGRLKLDVGIQIERAGIQCVHCGHTTYGTTLWIGHALFRPLLDSALEEQVDELEEQTVEA